MTNTQSTYRAALDAALDALQAEMDRLCAEEDPESPSFDDDGAAHVQRQHYLKRLEPAYFAMVNLVHYRPLDV